MIQMLLHPHFLDQENGPGIPSDDGFQESQIGLVDSVLTTLPCLAGIFAYYLGAAFSLQSLSA